LGNGAPEVAVRMPVEVLRVSSRKAYKKRRPDDPVSHYRRVSFRGPNGNTSTVNLPEEQGEQFAKGNNGDSYAGSIVIADFLWQKIRSNIPGGFSVAKREIDPGDEVEVKFLVSEKPRPRLTVPKIHGVVPREP